MAVNTMLIIFMVVAAILLFTSMILSAIAADKTKHSTDTPGQECHKNSTRSALVTGISVGVLLVVLIMYIYTSRSDIAAQTHAWIGNYVPQQMMPQAAVAPPSSVVTAV